MESKSLREMTMRELWRERERALHLSLTATLWHGLAAASRAEQANAELARRGVRLNPAQNEGGRDA